MSVGKVNFTGKSPNFGSISSACTNVCHNTERHNTEKALKKEIPNLMAKSIRTISKLSKFAGEVPNIIINAIGTGLVAPIFIKYNFLSKTDEDTRTYSALRQPISAVLSVAAQVGAVIPIDRLISKMSNSGQFLGEKLSSPKYNKEAFQDVDYIKKMLKKENPKLSAQELNDLADEKYLDNLDKLIKNAESKNSIEYMVKGKKVKLADEEIKKILEQVTSDMLIHAKDHPGEHAVIKEIHQAIKDKKLTTIKKVSEAISKKIPDNNFVYDVIQKHISNVNSNLKGLRQITGLVVSLATIPISCSVLNYVYPRVMDALFPRLSKKKGAAPKDTFQKACASTYMGHHSDVADSEVRK